MMHGDVWEAKQSRITGPSLPVIWQLLEIDPTDPSQARMTIENQLYLRSKFPSWWGGMKERTKRCLKIGGDQGDMITMFNVKS